MAKRYRVTLTTEERRALEAPISEGKGAARKLAHARIPVRADEAEGGPGRIDVESAGALNASVRTVERVRQRFVEAGLEAALVPKASSRLYLRLLDGAQAARLIALARSAPPEGKARWTPRSLAEQGAAVEIADDCSYETVRRVLKKTTSSRASARCG